MKLAWTNCGNAWGEERFTEFSACGCCFTFLSYIFLFPKFEQKDVGQKDGTGTQLASFAGHPVGLRRSLVSAFSQLDFGVATLARAWGSPLVIPRSGERGYGTTPLRCFDKALTRLRLRPFECPVQRRQFEFAFDLFVLHLLFKPWEQKDVGQKDETTSARGKHGESLIL